MAQGAFHPPSFTLLAGFTAGLTSTRRPSRAIDVRAPRRGTSRGRWRLLRRHRFALPRTQVRGDSLEPPPHSWHQVVVGFPSDGVVFLPSFTRKSYPQPPPVPQVRKARKTREIVRTSSTCKPNCAYTQCHYTDGDVSQLAFRSPILGAASHVLITTKRDDKARPTRSNPSPRQASTKHRRYEDSAEQRSRQAAINTSHAIQRNARQGRKTTSTSLGICPSIAQGPRRATSQGHRRA